MTNYEKMKTENPWGLICVLIFWSSFTDEDKLRVGKWLNEEAEE